MKLDPRQVKSKEKFHTAYLTLLIEGQSQFTIQQICAKAEVTRPTFYKLYKDIQELRIDIINKLLSELKEALTLENAKPLNVIPEEEMPLHLTLLFEHVQRNQIAYETLLIYHPDALFTNGIQDVLRAYVKDGLYLSQSRSYLRAIDEQLLIAYVSGAYMESIRWWISTNYKTDPVELAKTLIELSLYGPYEKRMR